MEEKNSIFFLNPIWFQVHFLIINATLSKNITQHIIQINFQDVPRARTQFWTHPNTLIFKLTLAYTPAPDTHTESM